MTTRNFFLKFEENNENDMAAQAFWGVFYLIKRMSQIGPTADFDGAAIPSLYFPCNVLTQIKSGKGLAVLI